MTIRSQSQSQSRSQSQSQSQSRSQSRSQSQSRSSARSEPQADGPAVEVSTDGGCGCGGCGCGGGTGGPDVVAIQTAPRASSDPAPDDLDLRPMTREHRHETVFAAVAALVPGEAFVLAVDHDPVPLRERLLAQESGELAWTYLQSGPDLWRVQVSRVSCC